VSCWQLRASEKEPGQVVAGEQRVGVVGHEAARGGALAHRFAQYVEVDPGLMSERYASAEARACPNHIRLTRSFAV